MSSASREAKLAAYATLIRKWNPAINLVAAATLPNLETRHLADSSQLATLAPPSGSWLDIGSGGGLPGIVVAIHNPDRTVTLVDSDQRKVAFLQTAIRELQLENCTAIAARIETMPPASARHVSARALAPLDRLMPYVARHMTEDGTAWLMKGRNWQAEVDAARKHWRFDITAHASATDPSAAILQISGLHRG